MGFFIADSLGNVVTCSKTGPLNGSIEYSNDTVFNQVYENQSEWKWLNDVFVRYPRPSLYHRWNGASWVYDPNLVVEAKKEMWVKIKEYRDYRLREGGYLTSVGWFHSDSEAQLNYEDLWKSKAQLPLMPAGDRAWKMMNGSFVTMTESIIDEIFSAKVVQKMTTFKRAEIHRLMMESSSDPYSYVYTTGWPTIYGE